MSIIKWLFFNFFDFVIFPSALLYFLSKALMPVTILKLLYMWAFFLEGIFPCGYFSLWAFFLVGIFPCGHFSLWAFFLVDIFPCGHFFLWAFFLMVILPVGFLLWAFFLWAFFLWASFRESWSTELSLPTSKHMSRQE